MSPPPRAAILVVGDEILSASVEDQNGPYLLRALHARGVEVVEVRQVGDQVAAIAEAVRALAARADVVVTTGGIGPTHDDVTMLGVATAFGLPLELDPGLHRFYSGGEATPEASRQPPPPAERLADPRPRGPGDDGRAAAGRKMASLPRGARAHLAAPGAPAIVPVVEVRNVFVLPGVPPLMRACFAALDVWGRGEPFVCRVLSLRCGESEVAATLAAVQADFADVQIGSYPQPSEAGERRLKVTCRGRRAARVEAATAALVGQINAVWLVSPTPGPPVDGA